MKTYEQKIIVPDRSLLSVEKKKRIFFFLIFLQEHNDVVGTHYLSGPRLFKASLT